MSPLSPFLLNYDPQIEYQRLEAIETREKPVPRQCLGFSLVGQSVGRLSIVANNEFSHCLRYFWVVRQKNSDSDPGIALHTCATANDYIEIQILWIYDYVYIVSELVIEAAMSITLCTL